MEEEAAPTTRRRMPSARMAAYLSGTKALNNHHE
jgi:hypothetical protein